MSKMILIGNSVEVIKPMRDGFVDLVVTSPPYGAMRAYNGYQFDFDVFKALAHELYRVIKKGGTMVWIVGDQTKDGTESGMSFEQALYFKNQVGFNLHDTMIYIKHGPPLTHNRYEQAFEYMFVLTKGKPKTFNGIRVPKSHPEKKPRIKAWSRYADDTRDYGPIKLTDDTRLEYNYWKINMGRVAEEDYAYDHPALFPEELARRHVISWSNPGDIVLDPFCGSGTTGKMALKEGRKFIGIDISREYASMACRRLGLKRAFEFGV